MPIVNWRALPAVNLPPRDIRQPWIVAIDGLGDGTHLRIEAEGEWVMPGTGVTVCRADGFPGAKIDATRLLLSDCPHGALLGKIGGSSAQFATVEKDKSAAPTIAIIEGLPFAIGSYLTAAMPAKSLGPLYIGFNDTMRPVNLLYLRLTVSLCTPTF